MKSMYMLYNNINGDILSKLESIHKVLKKNIYYCTDDTSYHLIIIPDIIYKDITEMKFFIQKTFPPFMDMSVYTDSYK